MKAVSGGWRSGQASRHHHDQNEGIHFFMILSDL